MQGHLRQVSACPSCPFLCHGSHVVLEVHLGDTCELHVNHSGICRIGVDVVDILRIHHNDQSLCILLFGTCGTTPLPFVGEESILSQLVLSDVGAPLSLR